MNRLAPLDWEFYGNTLRLWLVAGAVLVGSIGALLLLKRLIARRIAGLATRTATRLDDALIDLVQRTKFFFVTATAAFIASQVLALPGEVERIIRIAAVVAVLLQLAIWGNGLITFWTRQFIQTGSGVDPGSVTAVTALGFVARGLVWVIVFLLALANLGINVTALITGLGIGGIAVALAVQSSLSDVLGALSIVVGKPFVVGEFIIVGDSLGTVEYVGLRTTRLRSLSGEELTVPNKHLLENRIRNMTRMRERRVVLQIGVTYETPRQALEGIPAAIRETIQAREGTRFERAHFKGFGAYSLDFEAVYWILNPDYTVFMDAQQAINLEIMRRFEADGIEFAYPTQREIHLGLPSPELLAAQAAPPPDEPREEHRG
jgi:small-conductance mechanosensitive channel